MTATLQLAVIVVLGMAMLASAEDVPLCSSLIGPRFLSQFAPKSRLRAESRKCGTPISLFGSSAGFRMSERYVCKEGTATVSGPRLRLTYTCPPSSSVIPQEVVSPTIIPTIIPTIKPSTQPPSVPSSPSVPLPEGALCRDLVSGRRKTFFDASSRDRVCPVTCKTAISIFGFSAGFRSRTVFICCNGKPAERPPGFRRLLECPKDDEDMEGSAKLDPFFQ